MRSYGPKAGRRWAEFPKNRRGEPAGPPGPRAGAASRDRRRPTGRGRRGAGGRADADGDEPGINRCGAAAGGAVNGRGRDGVAADRSGRPARLASPGSPAASPRPPARVPRCGLPPCAAVAARPAWCGAGGADAGRAGARRLRSARRLIHQLPDPIHHRRVETGQGVGLDVQTPLLDALEQLLTLQAQFFGQLVNARRQRQLLPDLTPVSQASRDLGVFSMVRVDQFWIRIRRRLRSSTLLRTAVSSAGSMAGEGTRGRTAGSRSGADGTPASASRLTLFDRFGHDTNGLALIVIAGRGGHLVAMGRVIGFLDRQGHVVDLVVAGLVTLRIRAVVWGKFARDRAEPARKARPSSTPRSRHRDRCG